MSSAKRPGAVPPYMPSILAVISMGPFIPLAARGPMAHPLARRQSHGTERGAGDAPSDASGRRGGAAPPRQAAAILCISLCDIPGHEASTILLTVYVASSGQKPDFPPGPPRAPVKQQPPGRRRHGTPEQKRQQEEEQTRRLQEHAPEPQQEHPAHRPQLSPMIEQPPPMPPPKVQHRPKTRGRMPPYPPPALHGPPRVDGKAPTYVLGISDSPLRQLLGPQNRVLFTSAYAWSFSPP